MKSASFPSRDAITRCVAQQPLDLTKLEDPAFAGGTWEGRFVRNGIYDAGRLPEFSEYVTYTPPAGLECALPVERKVTVTERARLPLKPVLCPGQDTTVGGITFNSANPDGVAHVVDEFGTCEITYDVQSRVGDFVRVPDVTLDLCAGGQARFRDTIFATSQQDFPLLRRSRTGGCDTLFTVTTRAASGDALALELDTLCAENGPVDLGNQLTSTGVVGTWRGANVTEDGVLNPIGLQGLVRVLFTPADACYGGEYPFDITIVGPLGYDDADLEFTFGDSGQDYSVTVPLRAGITNGTLSASMGDLTGRTLTLTDLPVGQNIVYVDDEVSCTASLPIDVSYEGIIQQGCGQGTPLPPGSFADARINVCTGLTPEYNFTYAANPGEGGLDSRFEVSTTADFSTVLATLIELPKDPSQYSENGGSVYVRHVTGNFIDGVVRADDCRREGGAVELVFLSEITDLLARDTVICKREGNFDLDILLSDRIITGNWGIVGEGSTQGVLGTSGGVPFFAKSFAFPGVTYALTFTPNPGQCVDTATLDVVTRPLTPFPAGSRDVTVCAGSANFPLVTLLSDPSIPGAWEPNTVITADDWFNTSTDAVRSYPLKYITEESLCYENPTVNVTVQPSLPLQIEDQLFCGEGSAAADLNQLAKYKPGVWTDASGATLTRFDPTGLAPDVYVLTFTPESECIPPVKVQMVVAPEPEPGLGDEQVCSGAGVIDLDELAPVSGGSWRLNEQVLTTLDASKYAGQTLTLEFVAPSGKCVAPVSTLQLEVVESLTFTLADVTACPDDGPIALAQYEPANLRGGRWLRGGIPLGNPQVTLTRGQGSIELTYEPPAGQCAPPPATFTILEGTACSTECQEASAGTLEGPTAYLCAGQTLDRSPSGRLIIPAGFAPRREFVLDDDRDPTNGTLARDSDTKFNPDALLAAGTISYGQTLYIYGVVGPPEAGSTDRVDLLDPCTVVSTPLEVVWVAPMSVDLAFEPNCEGPGGAFVATLYVEGGVPPFTVSGGARANASPNDPRTLVVEALPSGSSVTLTVTGAGECTEPVDYALTYSCGEPACTADAGTLADAADGSAAPSPGQPFTTCGDGALPAFEVRGEVIPDDQRLYYILDEDTDPSAYLSSGSTAAFDLPAGRFGESLYLYTLVAPDADGDGEPEVAGVCAPPSEAVEVVWEENAFSLVLPACPGTTVDFRGLATLSEAMPNATVIGGPTVGGCDSVITLTLRSDPSLCPVDACTPAVVGTLADTDTVTVCAGQTLSGFAVSGNDPSTYGQLVYVLDEDTDPRTAPVATSARGDFNPAALPDLVLEQTYYLYAYAGAADAAGTGVDATDGCARTSSALPVVFRAPPAALLLDRSCNPTGDSAFATVRVVGGRGPFLNRGRTQGEFVPAGSRTFVTAGVAVGENFELQFVSAEGCEQADPLVFPAACDAPVCSGTSGQFSQSEVVVCGDGPLPVALETLGSYAPEPSRQYFLLYPTPDPTGTPLVADTSLTGIRLPDARFGEEFYLYSVIAPTDAAGQPDLQNACSGFSEAAAITWLEGFDATVEIVCDDANDTFVATVSYAVTRGTVQLLTLEGATGTLDTVARTFTIDPIPRTATATLTLGTDERCPSAFTFDGGDCAGALEECQVVAGFLAGADTTFLCSGQVVEGIVAGDPELDSGSDLIYVLSTDSARTADYVAVSRTLDFPMPAGGSDQTYYVFQVVGPAQAAEPFVDFAAACTRQSNARLVRWVEELEVATGVACDEAAGTYTVSFTLTGGAPPYAIAREDGSEAVQVQDGRYTSMPIPVGDEPRFLFSSRDGCTTLALPVSADDCTAPACGQSFPGTFASRSITVCAPFVTDLGFAPGALQQGEGRVFLVYGDEQLTEPLDTVEVLPLTLTDYVGSGETIYVVAATGPLVDGTVDLTCPQLSDQLAASPGEVTDSDLTFAICPGDSYTFRDAPALDESNPSLEYTAPGLDGACDTTFFVSVRVADEIPARFTDAVCGTSDYIFRGATFTPDAPRGEVRVPSTDGCDTVYTVEIAFRNATETRLDTTICPANTVQVGDELFYVGRETGQVTFPRPSGCDSVVNVTLTVATAPSITFGAPDTLCAAEELELVVTVLGGRDIRAREVVSGVVGAERTFSAGINAPLTFKASPGFTYALQDVVATGAEGCAATAGADATYAPTISQLEASILPSDAGSLAICGDGTLEALRAQGTGGATPYTFRWDSGEERSGLLEVGLGHHTVAVTDQLGCVDTASVEVVRGDTLAYILSVRAPGCGDGLGSATVTLDAAPAPELTYRFDGGADLPVGGQTITLESLPAGDYTLELNQPAGCLQEVTIRVRDTEPLELLPVDSLLTRLGDSVTLTIDLPDAPLDSVRWSPAVGLDCATCSSVSASPVANQAYTVTAYTADGCVLTDGVFLTVAPEAEVYIPSAFSPNDDGRNDVLCVYGDESVAVLERVSVYDRWGELLFVQVDLPPGGDDAGRCWDGTLLGEPLGTGVFVVIVEARFINGTRRTFAADVTLVR